jgi:cysteinyl-tRNA synthetase
MKAFLFDVLGLQFNAKKENQNIHKIMDLILELRQEARNRKDWNTSDKIRNGLSEAGISIKDEKSGSTWSIN